MIKSFVLQLQKKERMYECWKKVLDCIKGFDFFLCGARACVNHILLAFVGWKVYNKAQSGVFYVFETHLSDFFTKK